MIHLYSSWQSEPTRHSIVFNGVVIVALALAPVISLMGPVSQVLMGNGDGPRDIACPQMDGYSCTYEDKVNKGRWSFAVLGVGAVILTLGGEGS